METEKKLADIVFGSDPINDLENQTDVAFRTTNRKQFQTFYTLLISRAEERLSQQFGGCLALLEEKTPYSQKEIVKLFVSSEEYRLVREDLTHETQDSPARFEMAFLNFVLAKYRDSPALIEEFGSIYIQELALT